MKKLFLFAALLMTGFAFYSCEDVVDNPAKDPAQSWNYSVSVKFADFDFTGAPGTYSYQAPKTLYVFNEDMTLMGTISTDVAPTAGNYGTYAGKITGTIGNNLIIATKTGADLAKQDGTIESAIENGIVQMDKVLIKIYNANSGNITTASANLKNKTGIIQMAMIGEVKNDDKVITFSTDKLDIPGIEDKSFTITLDKNVNPSSFYVAVGTLPADDEVGFISVNADIDAPDRGVALRGNYKVAAINNGKIDNWVWWMTPYQIDLTKLWAAYKAEDETATSCNVSCDNEETVLTQSGTEAVPVDVTISSPKTTLKSINTRNLNFVCWDPKGATITLEGNNIVTGGTTTEGITIHNGIATITGTGTLDVTGGNNYAIVHYGNSLYDAENNEIHGKLIIDNGVHITASNANYGLALNQSFTSLELKEEAYLEAKGKQGIGVKADYSDHSIIVGKKATLKAIGSKDTYGLYIFGTLDIDDEGTVEAYNTGNGGHGAYIYSNDKDIVLGKKATLKAKGTPYSWNQIGWALQIITTGNVKVGEGSKIIAESENNRYALSISNATVDLGEAASITATMNGDDTYGSAMTVSNVTVKGKGSILAENKEKYYGLSANGLTLEGGSMEVIGAPSYYGIYKNGAITIGEKFTQLKVKTGQAGETPIYISESSTAAEAKIEDLVTDKTKFKDEKKDGYRTITPVE